jgi:hypothetical protein
MRVPPELYQMRRALSGHFPELRPAQHMGLAVGVRRGAGAQRLSIGGAGGVGGGGVWHASMPCASDCANGSNGRKPSVSLFSTLAASIFSTAAGCSMGDRS